MVICGDWNIAHNEIDLKNWKGNVKNSGFLPEERAWMTQLLGDDWCNVWRRLYPEAPGYSWWSNRGQAYAKDVGWRIDYHIVTPSLMAQARTASVYKDEKFSDHAPLTVDYDRSE
ncbi:Exodeoxyribonuclease [compost metagenome]